jgi:Ca2+-binding EF-hand superfamily protein
MRCLSKAYMKVSDREVEILVKELDQSGAGHINYKDFLKYTYLCHMYLNHFKLEMILNDLDIEKKGLITVAQLDKTL